MEDKNEKKPVIYWPSMFENVKIKTLEWDVEDFIAWSYFFLLQQKTHRSIITNIIINICTDHK